MGKAVRGVYAQASGLRDRALRTSAEGSVECRFLLSFLVRRMCWNYAVHIQCVTATPPNVLAFCEMSARKRAKNSVLAGCGWLMCFCQCRCARTAFRCCRLQHPRAAGDIDPKGARGPRGACVHTAARAGPRGARAHCCRPRPKRRARAHCCRGRSKRPACAHCRRGRPKRRADAH
jgi:hypothetical protein